MASLTSVLRIVGGAEEQDSLVNDSFGHAMKGLGAEKGALLLVRQELPLELEVRCASGLTAEEEAACLLLTSSPGVNASVIRKAAQRAEATLIDGPDAENGDAGQGNRLGVLCAAVTDSFTGGTIAVLYFQCPAGQTFDAGHSSWLTAYATALRHALAVTAYGQQAEPLAPASHPTSANGPEIVGPSAATRRLVTLLDTLLPSTSRPDAPPILLTGESGTGKELVARYLHYRSAKRHRGPLQAFNCAAVRGELAESKLFGHARGAFTGAVADTVGLFRTANRGVLFLDEIGELPLDSQALLLRVLETRTIQALGDTREVPVDVQLIAATNRRLEDEVAAGRFREDLYYRLSGLRVELKPLRDPTRIADLRPLVAFYIARHERLLRKKTLGLTSAAFRVLLRYSWPGNVRQVNNVCLSLVTHARAGAWIDVADIQALRPEVLSGPGNPHPEALLEDESLTYGEAIRVFRTKLIHDRLRRHGGKAASAAASLGISEPTFYRYWADAKRLS